MPWVTIVVFLLVVVVVVNISNADRVPPRPAFVTTTTTTTMSSRTRGREAETMVLAQLPPAPRRSSNDAEDHLEELQRTWAVLQQKEKELERNPDEVRTHAVCRWRITLPKNKNTSAL